MTTQTQPRADTRPGPVASLTGSHIHCHDTPAELYQQLAALFGEQQPSDGSSPTRWVAVGAGAHLLTFFRSDD